MNKIVEQCFEKCRPFLIDYIMSGKQLGIQLVECRKVLTVDDWTAFERCFEEYGLNSRDIKAAMMLAEGTLQPELYFSGVKNDKILNMKQSVRDLLVDSTYEIAIKRESDHIEFMPFLKMSPSERRQVIGRNRILSPEEQTLPDAKKGNNNKPNVGPMNYVMFLDSQLIFKGEKLEYADFNVGLFKKQLADKNQLKAFVDFLNS